ncbi:MAG TPA: response regulator transcription factor, partial [Candidatus Didemnitutus sp.]|nr:response regulator transcription factor [Candidatus Didemnitutus sp.]
ATQSVGMGRQVILCIEDDVLLRDYLVAQLEQIVPEDAEIQVAADGQTGLQLARELNPSLVVLDLGLPDVFGFDIAQQLSLLRPPPKTLAISASATDSTLNRVPYSPIHGFILKSSAQRDEFGAAVLALMNGGTYFPPHLNSAISRARSHPEHYAKILSQREIELLALLGYGWSNERIAQHVGLSATTIRTHRQHILGRLGLHSTEELMRWAQKKGFSDFRYEPRALNAPTVSPAK